MTLIEALQRIIDTRHEMPALRYTYFPKGKDSIIVSDSTVLVEANPREEDPLTLEFMGSGKLVDMHTGHFQEHLSYPEIRGVFVDSEGVIRGTFLDKGPMFGLSVREVKDICDMVPNSPDVDGERIVLAIGNIYIYPPRLRLVLDVMEANGEEMVLFRYGEDRLQLHGDLTTAVIMYVFCKTNPKAIPPHRKFSDLVGLLDLI